MELIKTAVVNKESRIFVMPREVRHIIDTLEDAGFEAFAVGGCVRDTLLNRKPEDWDITTNAKPSDVQKKFRRTIATGIIHGTVTIMRGDIGYEVTTYRIDGAYSDGRHPDNVEFTKDLKEDLRRRDFTINAMAYSDKIGLVDVFKGMEDLEHGLIRCVGEARERFNEDALRILRAIRFRAQLGFQIHQDTELAAKELAPTLVKISKERIMIELTKLILSENPHCLQDIFRLGLDPYLAENFSKLRDLDFEEVAKLNTLPKKKHLHFAYLLQGFGRDEILSFLKELKLDNDNIDKIRTLVAKLPEKLPRSRVEIKRLLSEIGNERFDDLLCMKSKSVGFKGLMEDVVKTGEIKRDVLNKKEPYTLKDLKINGSDLIREGVKQGPGMKQILNEILNEVIEDPQKNEKDILLKSVQQKILVSDV